MRQDPSRWIILLLLLTSFFWLFFLGFTGCQGEKTKAPEVKGPHIILTLKPAEGSENGEIPPEIMDKTIMVLKERLQPLSMDEFKFQVQGKNQLVILVPSNVDMEKARLFAGKRGYIEFREKPQEKGAQWKKVMDGSSIESAKMEFSRQGKAMLSYVMKNEDRSKFAEIADRNGKQPLGIYLDGVLLYAPPAQTAVPNGIGRIENDRMSKEDFENLVVMLNSGALPVDVQVDKVEK